MRRSTITGVHSSTTRVFVERAERAFSLIKRFDRWKSL